MTLVRDLRYSLRQALKTHYLVVVLFGLCVQRLVWFQGNRALIGGDLLPSLDPVSYLGRMTSSWDEINLGNLNDLQPRVFYPQHLFEALGQITGVGLAGGQKFLVVTMFVIAGFSIYYLWPLVFRAANWKTPAFFAAFAYVFNPFLIGDGINSALSNLHSYALVPLSLLFTMKGLHEQDLKWAIALSFISPFILSDFPTLHTFYFVAFTIVSFSAWYAFSFRKLQFAVSFLLSSLALSILINLWWILPLLQNLNSYLNTLANVPAAIGVNGFSTVIEVFRFLGKWSFYTSYQGVPYIPYSNPYTNNSALVILSFAPSILAFGALILRPRDKTVVSVALIAVVSFFLAKGDNAPVGFLYSDVLALFPPFKAFRESWYLVQLAVIPASLLIGVSTGRVLLGVKSPAVARSFGVPGFRTLFARYAVAFVFIILIVVPGWPLLTGEVVALPFNSGSHGVSIPSYYNDFISWNNHELQAEGDFKVLELPQRGAYAAFTWGYQGGDLLGRSMPNLISAAGTEYSASSGAQWIVDLAYGSFYANNASFARILSSIGVRYVIMETDFNSTFYGIPSIQSHLELLQRTQGLEFVRGFGPILVFRDLFPSSTVYVPSTLRYVTASVDNPQGIVWEDHDFSSGWVLEKWGNDTPGMEVTGTDMRLTLHSSGAYVASSVLRTISLNGTSPNYMLLRFRTDPHTSMTVQFVGSNQSYYPKPLNSPTPGHSASLQWYTLAYQVPTNFTMTAVRVWITNYHDPGFSGQLELWLNYVRLANTIGSDNEVMGLLSNSSLMTPFVLIRQQDSPEAPSTLTSTPYVKGATILSVVRDSPTSFKVKMNVTAPSLLFLGESFSPQWRAYANGKFVSNHFVADGFANAWLINETGLVNVELTFFTQNYILYGIIIALITASLVLIIPLRGRFWFRITRPRQVRNDRTA